MVEMWRIIQKTENERVSSKGPSSLLACLERFLDIT